MTGWIWFWPKFKEDQKSLSARDGAGRRSFYHAHRAGKSEFFLCARTRLGIPGTRLLTVPPRRISDCSSSIYFRRLAAAIQVRNSLQCIVVTTDSQDQVIILWPQPFAHCPGQWHSVSSLLFTGPTVGVTVTVSFKLAASDS